MKKLLGSLFVALTFSTIASPMAEVVEEFPLHAAAERGDAAEVERLLVAGGCGVNDENDFRVTPLILATINDRDDCVKKLLQYSADVEVKEPFINRTSLHIAAEHGNADIVKVLLEGGADVRARSYSGWTPLHYAAREGHLACVEYLVYEAGADVEAKNGEGKTPKDFAAENGKQDVVKFFDDYQAQPDIKEPEVA